MQLQKLYINSPRLVKSTIGRLINLIPKEILYGKEFRRVSKLIHEVESLPKTKILEMQFKELKRILRYSYNNVPYYTNLFNEHGINVEMINSFDDFRKIPYLDKKIIRKSFDALQSASFQKNESDYVTTGGTSGFPLGFNIDKNRLIIEWAYIMAVWSRYGYKLNSKRVVFRGEVVKQGNKLWFYDPALNQLTLSSFHMDDSNLFKYIQMMNDFKPEFIHAYPSAALILATFIKKRNIKLKFNLKGIIGVSEGIVESRRSYIEENFGVRMFSHYGHSEKLIYAGECEKSRNYHIEPLYGMCEIVNNSGLPVLKDGEIGELVGTGFINRAMPFIRYKTGDFAELSTSKCDCGRNYTILKKVYGGRFMYDLVVTKNDSLISIVAINLHSRAYNNVKEFQFEQFVAGELILNLVKYEDFVDEDEFRICEELNNKFCGQIDLKVKFVNDIDHTTSGKKLYLKQHIDIDKSLMWK